MNFLVKHVIIYLLMAVSHVEMVSVFMADNACLYVLLATTHFRRYASNVKLDAVNARRQLVSFVIRGTILLLKSKTQNA